MSKRDTTSVSNPNQTSAYEKCLYRTALVTFVDVLGFRKLVSTKPADEIGDALDRLIYMGSGEVEDGDPPAGLSRSFAFSDCIVRVCPVDVDGRYGALFYELLSLVHLQTDLAGKGIFLRGGVTIGDISWTGSKIFGPALVKAYELESQVAIYPRIVVDPAVLEAYFQTPAMQGEAHDITHDIGYVDDLLNSDTDQIPFVDYLASAKTEFESFSDSKEFLADHRRQILTAAASNTATGFSKVKQKYCWLAGYHNNTIEKILDEDNRAPFLIELHELEESV